MPNDDASEPQLPHADRAYALYLETCRRLGVDPVPRERAQDFMAEWSNAIAAGRAPPTIHWGADDLIAANAQQKNAHDRTI